MKLALMQPYFLAYLGYWQMIKAVDTFVVYDDVNYIKGGWINRNNLLDNGKAHLFTLVLKDASPFKKINEIEIDTSLKSKNKVLDYIRNSYRKAPYFKEVFPVIESIIMLQEPNLAQFLFSHFQTLCSFLNIKTTLLLSSRIEKDNTLKSQDKVLEVCKKLKATRYINAIGGQDLYSTLDFANQGIDLKFLAMRSVVYSQFKNDFVANLSLLDILMFQGKEITATMLDNYDLIEGKNG